MLVSRVFAAFVLGLSLLTFAAKVQAADPSPLTEMDPEVAKRFGQMIHEKFAKENKDLQFKVEPNTVRALEPGEAYLISRGRAMRAQILTAPHLTRPLPDLAGAGYAPRGDKPLATQTQDTVASVRTNAGRDCSASVPPRTVLSESEVANLPF